MGKKLGLLIPLGLAVSGFCGAVTLQEAVVSAIDTNPEVAITTADRRAIDQERRQAKAGFLPRIDLLAGTGGEKSNNSSTRAATGDDAYVSLHRNEFEVQLTQMLFDGFFTKNEVARHDARIQAAAYRVYATSEEIALRAIEAYIEVLRRQALVTLAEENYAAHDRTYGQIKQRGESGIGRNSDVTQAEGRLALARANLMAEQANLVDAKTAYIRVVGAMPTDLEAAPMATSLPESLAQGMDAALVAHPTMQAALADIEAAKSQHETARANDLPRFDAELGATNHRNIDGVRGTNEDLTAMVRMKYNLYRGGADEARKQQTAHLISQAKEVYNRARDQVIENTSLSWNDYVTTTARLDFLKMHKDSSIATRDAYQKQFNLGQRTLLDLLDTENEVFSAQSAYETARYRQLFAGYRILSSQGAVMETVGVAAPEETMVATQ
ncbi:MAG: TolC family outer membrane protein [Gammaproteobacteria bacterium]|nr:TolC family outer membrane protein [Gammaproteobacteria bacterium]